MWEYTYAWASVKAAAESLQRPVSVLDVGSGCTFFPFLISEKLGSAVTASDSLTLLGEFYDNLARQRPAKPPVFFHLHDARKQSTYPDGVFDIITCVSVMEHTDSFQAITQDLHRQLRAGGFLVLTFDIAKVAGQEIQPHRAVELLSTLASLFKEIRPPPYAYSDKSIERRIKGEQGAILESQWVMRELPEYVGLKDYHLTISCHVFQKD
jgi:SAM-dependent methyltransferase